MLAVLLPDLFVYWLTGHQGAEVTNASTTGLLAAGGDAWDGQLIRRLGLPAGLLAPLRRPGDHAGVIEPRVAKALDLGSPVPVTVAASHDTASAVAAVPARGPAFGYVSAGTWSLGGIETDRPALGEGERLCSPTWTPCTSWGAAPGTACCAREPPTPAAFPCRRTG